VAALLLLASAVVFLIPVEEITFYVTVGPEVQRSPEQNTETFRSPPIVLCLAAFVLNVVPLAAHLALYAWKLELKTNVKISWLGLWLNGVTIGLVTLIIISVSSSDPKMFVDFGGYMFLLGFVFMLATYASSFWVFFKSHQEGSRLLKMSDPDVFT
jgi:hypothetical protein